MQKLVIFDLDGTLLDSLPDIRYYLNETLEKFNYPTHEKDAVKQFIGRGARNLVKDGLPKGISDEELERCLEYYNDVYTNSSSPRTKLFDGVEDMILTLNSRGYRIAILTNKPQMTTDEIVKKYMSDLPIDIIIGQREGVKIKPDPTVTNEIILNANADKKETYFVGDGETDVATAINANINGVAVLWGYRTKEQLQVAGAKLFAEKISDLLDILK